MYDDLLCETATVYRSQALIHGQALCSEGTKGILRRQSDAGHRPWGAH